MNVIPYVCFRIPLPPWVREEIEHNPDILFTNKRGMKSYDYISFGCDTLPILQGRSPVQVYADFMRGFRDEFKDYIGEVLVVYIYVCMQIYTYNSKN